MKKKLAFLFGLVLSVAVFLGVTQSAEKTVSAYTAISQITDFSVYGSTHGKEGLASLSNSTHRIYLYEQLYNEAVAFWNNQSDLTWEWDGAYVIKAIDISEYGLSPNEVVETYYSFQNDNPIFYFASNTVSLSGSEVMFLTDADYRQASVRNQCKTYIINGLNEFGQLLDGKTGNDAKILAAYEKIMSRISYAYESDGVTPVDTPWSHNIMGYFNTTINKGVCECYASTLQLVLNMAGVDSYFVTGESNAEAHAWNMAQFGDGNYYYMDATWDDENNSFGYFAKGQIFEENHHKNRPNNSGTKYLYAIPDAPATDYAFPVSGNIASVEDFKKIALNPSGSYTLTANLDFSNVKSTKQDDYFLDMTFKGTLNGNGYTISGLTFGLIREIGEGATVSNIKLKADFGSNAWKGDQSFYYIYKSALAENNRGTVKDCDLTYVMNDCSIAGLQGVCIGGLLYANYGTVDSCDNSITVNNFAYSYNTNFLVQVSSVATFHWGGTIKNCTAKVNVTNSSDYTKIALHAIASEMETGTTIDNCTTNGSVMMKDKGTLGFGGIVANNFGGTISNCTNNCDVDASTGTFMASGGIAISNINTIYDDGSLKGVATIKNCTNNGDFYNRYTAVMEGYSRAIGGISPNNGGYISGCKNTGNITVEIGAGGGIFGECGGDSTVENCTNSGNITGIQASTWMTCVGGIGGQAEFNSGTFDENGNFTMIPGGSCTIKNCTNSGTITAEYGAGCIIGNIHLAAPGSEASVTGCTNNGTCNNDGKIGKNIYYQYVPRSDGTSKFTVSSNTNLVNESVNESVNLLPEENNGGGTTPTTPAPTNPAPTESDTEENTTSTEEETISNDEEETTTATEEETTKSKEETTKSDEDNTTVSEEENTTASDEKDDKGKDKKGIKPIIVVVIVVVVLGAAGAVTFLIIRKKKASNVEEN